MPHTLEVLSTTTLIHYKIYVTKPTLLLWLMMTPIITMESLLGYKFLVTPTNKNCVKNLDHNASLHVLKA